MKITVQGVQDLRKLASGVREIDRHIPFAAAVALTRTARLVQREIEDEMRDKFDRPTPMVMRSLRVIPAKKSSLEARVFLKNIPLGRRASGLADVIAHQFFGGKRRSTGAEVRLRAAKVLPRGKHIVPSARAGRDVYGNLPRSEIVQMLTELRGITPGRKSMSDRQRRRKSKQGLLVSRGFKDGRRTLDQQYFVTRGRNSEAIGIWRIVGPGRVEPFVVFTSAPKYKQRIDIDTIGRRIMREHFGREFGRAFAQAIKTGSYRGGWK